MKGKTPPKKKQKIDKNEISVRVGEGYIYRIASTGLKVLLNMIHDRPSPPVKANDPEFTWRTPTHLHMTRYFNTTFGHKTTESFVFFFYIATLSLIIWPGKWTQKKEKKNT